MTAASARCSIGNALCPGNRPRSHGRGMTGYGTRQQNCLVSMDKREVEEAENRALEVDDVGTLLGFASPS